jgi:hypothetical protein
VYLASGRTDDAMNAVQQALKLTRAHGLRGGTANALRVLGDVCAVAPAGGGHVAEAAYREGLDLAIELGMRPLVAHCHLGLGKLHRRTGDRAKAEAHLGAAASMYREMGMRIWLVKAEAEVGRLG